jgi:hypothetical protein
MALASGPFGLTSYRTATPSSTSTTTKVAVSLAWLGMLSNALEPALACAADALIHTVLSSCRFSQILDAIIH